MDGHGNYYRLNTNMNIAMVGDGCVGKTSLWYYYTKGEPYPVYCETVFDDYNVSVPIDGTNNTIHLLDTAGRDAYDRLRPLCYPCTDALILMFSVVRPASYENVRDKWIPEVRHYRPNIPIVLVGNKIDLREDPETLRKLMKTGQEPITSEMGKHLAKEISALKYMECSCMSGTGVVHVFQESVRAFKKHHEAKTKKMIKENRKTAKKSKKIRKCKMITTHVNDVIDPPVVHYL